ncbi:Hypothetical predicted protein [Cloeon dipterum]|uniref:BOS complex subunit TMEM147 n=1 Tax=Cloeon dipterum TaxID=197152 RepID=A0A8S1BWL2_9INSE|nr:Hypothetical predicted protein [Cloeon dipterum]
MTFYHFVNCVALVYVPYHFTYKLSGLSEYGAFWKCFQAAQHYVFTQLVKMIVVATFFPESELEVKGDGNDAFSEWLKASVDLADLAGLYLVLAKIPGKGHNKILTAAVGWGGAEMILSHVYSLWFGARGAEFDWKYIQGCLDSNISLVQHISTAALVWLWSRHDLKKTLMPIVYFLLLAAIFKPVLFNTLLVSMGYGPWLRLALKAVTTGALGLVTLYIYSGLAKAIGVY